MDSVAISSAGGENRILLNANDFIEDPHFVATYPEMQQFFIKQSQVYSTDEPASADIFAVRRSFKLNAISHYSA